MNRKELLANLFRLKMFEIVLFWDEKCRFKHKIILKFHGSFYTLLWIFPGKLEVNLGLSEMEGCEKELNQEEGKDGFERLSIGKVWGLALAT